MVTYQDIAKTIWQVESTLNPWVWKTAPEHGDWYWWPLIRMKMYYRLGEQAGVFDLSYSKSAANRTEVTKRYAWLKQVIRWRFASRKNLPLHLDGERRDHETGEDVYLSPWANQAHVSVDWACQPVAMVQQAKWAWALGRVLLGIPSVTIPDALDTQTKEHCQRLAQVFEQKLGVRLDVGALALNAIRAAVRQRAYALGLLNTLGPSNVRLTCAYGKEGIIAAAKQLGIPVTEVQHGTIHPYHLGYAYPPECYPAADSHPQSMHPYLPNGFASWGAFWSETVAVPWHAEQIETVGYSVFRKEKERYAGRPRQQQCVVLSQPVLLPQMVEALLSVPLSVPVLYKCHPHELASTDPSVKDALQRLSAQPNIRIVPKETPLYEVLAESEYCAGVFSSALFEALGMGCKTVLMDLPGIEAMAPLRKRYPALPVWQRGYDWSRCFTQADAVTIEADAFF